MQSMTSAEQVQHEAPTEEAAPADGSAVWLGEMEGMLKSAGIDPLAVLRRVASIQARFNAAVEGPPDKLASDHGVRLRLPANSRPLTLADNGAAPLNTVAAWWAGANVHQDDKSAELEIAISPEAVDYTQQVGQHGIPWSWGVLNWDPNDDLAPFLARGRGQDLGVWHDHLNTPPVEQGIMKPVRALAGLDWAPRPARLPEYADDADRALCAKHWEFCARALDRWEPGATGDLVEQILRNVPGFGWQLWELMGEQAQVKLDGQVHTHLLPMPPVWVSHNALDYWLLSKEKFVGAIFDFSHSVDADGTVGPRVVLPREKLMWIGRCADGSNLEGRSVLRAHYSQTEMYRAFMELQALAAEINGLGDRVVVGPEKSSKPVRTAVTDWMNKFVARTVPWLYLPHGSQYMVTSPNTGKVDFTPMLNFLKTEIAAVHDSTSELVGIIHSAGSFALKKDSSAQGQKNYQYVATRMIAQPVARELFLPFLRLAFPDDPVYYPPMLLTEDLGASDDTAWVQGVSTAASTTVGGVPLLYRQDSIGRAVRARFNLDEDLELQEDLSGEDMEPTGGEGGQEEEGGYAKRLEAIEAMLAERGPGVRLAETPAPAKLIPVVGRDGRTFMAARPLRDNERHMALADIEDLLDSAERRGADALQRVAVKHLAFLVKELGEDLDDLPAPKVLAALDKKARGQFEPQYLSGVRPEFRRVATQGVKEVKAEVESAGLVDGTFDGSIDATDASDAHAALVAVEAFNRVHGHVTNTILNAQAPSIPEESTFRSMCRRRVSWVFNAARRKAMVANTDVLAGDVVERVSVLDRETCPDCEELDGQRAPLASRRAIELQPPRGCQGRGNCRCGMTLIGRNEGQ